MEDRSGYMKFFFDKMTESRADDEQFCPIQDVLVFVLVGVKLKTI